MKSDEVIKAALGPHVWDRYLEAKYQEWNEYRTRVHQWELDRYLAVY
jgi:glutamine synthetase